MYHIRGCNNNNKNKNNNKIISLENIPMYFLNTWKLL